VKVEGAAAQVTHKVQ